MNNTPGPEGHSREYVSLRDYTERLLADVRNYLDRLLADHASLHIKEALSTEREAALVRTVLEQRMTDHDLRHDEQHRSDLRAVDQASKSLEAKLEKLNELRQVVDQVQGTFVTRQVWDTQRTTADKERQQMRDDQAAFRTEVFKELGGIRQDVSNIRTRTATITAAWGVGLVILSIAVNVLLRTVG